MDLLLLKLYFILYLILYFMFRFLFFYVVFSYLVLLEISQNSPENTCARVSF